MADDKRGRDAQARNADRRQRERDVIAARERMDEVEPPLDDADLDDVGSALESVSFPATGATVVAAAGDLTVAASGSAYELRDLVPETDAETFESTVDLRERLRRPTVAAAMKRVAEAAGTHGASPLRGSQRDAYEKTFLALAAIDADDDDAGVGVVADWIVERIETTGALPGSRAVRREAASFCRAEGYEIRNDEWLGV